MNQAEDMASFKQAKHQLAERLSALNDKLNQRLHAATTDIPYHEWMESHQPFHWLAEFYQIIKGNGGFDVVIGNPPYVEYSKVKTLYQIKNYETIACGNLYAFCVERSKSILNYNAYFGMIIPLSITCGERMESLRTLASSAFDSVYSCNFEIFPSKLFAGAFQRVTILLGNNSNTAKYVSKLHRWYSVERTNLFSKIIYAKADSSHLNLGIAKLYTNLHGKIIGKLIAKKSISNIVSDKTNNLIYYQEATNYWMKACLRIPYYKKNGNQETPAHGRILYFSNDDYAHAIFALLNSSLFYCWYSAFSDGFHLTDNLVKRFPIDDKILLDKRLVDSASKLETDISNNSFIATRNTKTDNIELESFKVNLSKPIIDKIDAFLANILDFSDEELDFIINYDIKYRMGDELNLDE
jgi:hypothetical protein